jgi:phospholipid-binding lipoprotein MlaA
MVKYLNMTIKCLKICFFMNLLFISSCSSNRYVTNPNDPFEPMNRSFYQLNKVVDALYIKPAAKLYEICIPNMLRNKVTNFLNNLNEVPTIINSLLQNKCKQAIDSTARFTINSTLGIGGLFDIASKNIPRTKEDFGKTLAVWGYKNSHYLVLPIIGPSTVRDSIGFGVNTFMSVPYYLKPKWRNRYVAANTISRRSQLAETELFIDNLSIDEYTLLKEAYLQNREYSIYGLKDQDNMLSDPP